MLEQYRKDLPKEEKDFLPDSDAQGKKKFLFALTGAAFALVFVLFLMGVFRTDDETLVKENRPDAVTKENVLALEEKIQALTARLEKLEGDTVASKPTTQPVHDVAVTESQDTTPVNSCEDAVHMTHQALHNMIAKEAEVAQEEFAKANSKKETSNKLAKAPKAKKGKVDVAQNHEGKSLHVVQKGETLSKISQRYFGTPNRWKTIYDANKEKIANINNLKVGTSLVIPEAKQ